MWQLIIIWIIIGICAFFLGRRLYRQWRAALTPGKNVSCGGGCSCCSASGCDEPKKLKSGM
ncbi:MAG: FeoB-associated Cys-rich membrane protein [Desulfobulbaceae bacterium]|nr:MAG: FeoB-associated Cys-rich membrane protein [Desulfobulbaceae bacterium]